MLWLTYLERFKSRLVEYLKYMFLSTRISKKIQTILLKFFYRAFHVAGLLIRAHSSTTFLILSISGLCLFPFFSLRTFPFCLFRFFFFFKFIKKYLLPIQIARLVHLALCHYSYFFLFLTLLTLSCYSALELDSGHPSKATWSN